jgi:hypothetical protein
LAERNWKTFISLSSLPRTEIRLNFIFIFSPPSSSSGGCQAGELLVGRGRDPAAEQERVDPGNFFFKLLLAPFAQAITLTTKSKADVCCQLAIGR